MQIRTFCFVAALGAAIFACSSAQDASIPEGATDSASSDLAVVCGKGECGPELGLPTIKCDDGSIGGSTGRCIRSAAATACHWEVRACPTPTPPPVCDCGPEPMILVKCDDGSVESPKCVPSPEPVASGAPTPAGKTPSTAVPPNKCHWQIEPCPGPTPTPAPVPVPPIAKCPPGEHVCELSDAAGYCVEKCVPMGAMCVAPTCKKPICDPPGPPPHGGCIWDLKTCSWLCV